MMLSVPALTLAGTRGKEGPPIVPGVNAGLCTTLTPVLVWAQHAVPAEVWSLRNVGMVGCVAHGPHPCPSPEAGEGKENSKSESCPFSPTPLSQEGTRGKKRGRA